MDFRKFASGFLIVGNLLGSSFSFSASADESCGAKVVSELSNDSGVTSVGNFSNCLDKVNGFFRSCGKKMKIEDEKSAEALGWTLTGGALIGATIGLVKGVCALVNKSKKENEVKSSSSFDITTHTTVTLNSKDSNEKESVKDSKSVVVIGDSPATLVTVPKTGDVAADKTSVVGSLGSDVSSTSVGGFSKFASSVCSGNTSSRSSVSRYYPREGGFRESIRGCYR